MSEPVPQRSPYPSSDPQHSALSEVATNRNSRLFCKVGFHRYGLRPDGRGGALMACLYCYRWAES